MANDLVRVFRYGNHYPNLVACESKRGAHLPTNRILRDLAVTVGVADFVSLPIKLTTGCRHSVSTDKSQTSRFIAMMCKRGDEVLISAERT